jgi:uncharacterized protein
MELGLARQAVDAYLKVLSAAGRSRVDVHFFGGEPFFAETVVHFIVEYTSLRAAELGMTSRFEATTNGVYSTSSCRWIADNFDTVVLSLDGPQDVQERQRPSLNGRQTFATVTRNARIFSESAVDLVIRACVTNETVGRMPEIAAWLADEFHPSTVCFETLTESAHSRISNLFPPSPWEYARQYVHAARLLGEYGIETVLSTTNLRTCQASFCPVGKDALIISPDGAVVGCNLRQEDWSRNGLDMHFGRVRPEGFDLDDQAVQRVRNLSVENKPPCAECLCRYNCTGGCHVKHDLARAPGQYDDLCLQTRLVTIANLLGHIQQDALVDDWLADRRAMAASALQRTDRLFGEEVIL